MAEHITFFSLVLHEITSEWIHLISGVPVQKNYQWWSQVTAPDLWLNYITCFTQMLVMVGHEHLFPRLMMQGLSECGERKNWYQFLPSVFFATFKSLSAGAAAPLRQRYDILGFSLSSTTRAKSHSCYLLCFLLFLALLQCLRVE